MTKKGTQLVLLVGMMLVIVAFACNKANRGPVPEDAALMLEVEDTTGSVYSILTPEIMDARGNSPRDYYRVRYNEIARSVLDESGKLPQGEVFPDGSLIVKEAYESKDPDAALIQYAIMKKDSESPYQAEGWTWYEVNADGSKPYSLARDGRKCLRCHVKKTNRDATRMSDLY